MDLQADLTSPQDVPLRAFAELPTITIKRFVWCFAAPTG
jgi:hypothetical protein